MSDELAEARQQVLGIWREDRVIDESRFLDKLREQHRQAEAARQETSVVVCLLTQLVVSGDEGVVLAAAQELANAREQLERLGGKAEKLEREIVDVQARVARWRALRRWATR